MYGSIIFLVLDRFSGGGTKFSQVQTGSALSFRGVGMHRHGFASAHGAFTEPQANR